MITAIVIRIHKSYNCIVELRDGMNENNGVKTICGNRLSAVQSEDFADSVLTGVEIDTQLGDIWRIDSLSSAALFLKGSQDDEDDDDTKDLDDLDDEDDIFIEDDDEEEDILADDDFWDEEDIEEELNGLLDEDEEEDDPFEFYDDDDEDENY